MTGRTRRCPVDSTYTLLPSCPLCGTATVTAHPARYSPEDRFGFYRRVAKERAAGTSGQQV